MSPDEMFSVKSNVSVISCNILLYSASNKDVKKSDFVAIKCFCKQWSGPECRTNTTHWKLIIRQSLAIRMQMFQLLKGGKPPACISILYL